MTETFGFHYRVRHIATLYFFVIDGTNVTSDLLKLEQFRPLSVQLDTRLLSISTPLIVKEWESLLADHPNPLLAGYLLRGISTGFRIGFDRSKPLRSATSNMHSVREHPEVVNQYLRDEVRLERVLGPFTVSEAKAAGWHISKFGVIPKRHSLNKWRLIVDLSWPEKASVNDGIDSSLCSLTYTKVDAVADAVCLLGRGTELAKADIKAAYRIIPVHPEDRPLLAMQWEGAVYIDGALPFGLRSAPKIFNASHILIELNRS